MFIEKWLIAVVAIIIIILLILIWQSQRQVRALRFCFFNFSDAIKRVIDENEYLLEHPNSEAIPGFINSLNQTWGDKLDWVRMVMYRANLKWFSVEDKWYALED